MTKALYWSQSQELGAMGMFRIIRQYVADLECRLRIPELYDERIQRKRLQLLFEPFERKTVAVVGNAASLFDVPSGASIDDADVVIRINEGAPANFVCQGRRTDILCLATPTGRTSIEKMFGDPAIVFVSPRRAVLSRDLVNSVAFLPLQDWSSISVLIDGHRPSAGMIATWMARHLLRSTSVALYGFDWKRTKTYYADKMRRNHHNWALEKALMRSWSEQGWLRLPPTPS
jgi:glycosyl transferase family 29 (putative sialyltransferase)